MQGDGDTAERPAVKPVKKKRQRAGFGAVVAVVVILLLVVGGGWAAAYAFAGDKLPHGATVAGVKVGDLTVTEAAEALRDGLADRVAAPITVDAGGQTATVDPAEVGLEVNYVASVAQAASGKSWDPQRLWEHYTGGASHDAIVTIDDDALAGVADRLDTELGTPAQDGGVALAGTGVQVTDAVTGKALDHDALREGLLAAFLSDQRTVEVDLTDVVPDIDADDVRTAVDTFANPAMSGPVTLRFGDSPIVLQPEKYAGVLSLQPKDGTLQPVVDQDALTALVSKRISKSSKPVDATVKLVDGKPTVIPAKPGASFDPQQVSDTFLALVAKPAGQREQAVAATVAEPKISTAAAEAWGIKEKVSEFTTYFPYAEYRNINIGRAAEIVDGTILEPGDTFSLNDIVGERTRENGFTEGWTIQNGVFYSDLGGGVSQMATTTFNAMFFAGLKDVEHKPHSLYISRYPVGREATVAWGSVDLKFTNDTPYGILIHSWVTKSTPSSQGSVTVQMWSTKTWDITTKTSDRYAFTPFEDRTIESTNCEATEGAPGFQVDVWRYFHQPGSEAIEKTEKFHTTYIPQDHVTCQAPESGKPD
ncbi:VanW family protein [Nocardioides sp.]|uniref:VanW family protein n=1 Tax=Nocardioides sp. TaxID=35761 RepID=UPI0039E3480D